MSSLVKNHRHFLHVLWSTSSVQSKAMMHTLSSPQVKFLVELIVNILRKNVSGVDVAQLKPYAALMRKIDTDRNKVKKMKRMMKTHWKAIINILKISKTPLHNRLQSYL